MLSTPERKVLMLGAFDTKAVEYAYVRQRILSSGHDLSIHLFAGEPDHDAVHRVAHLTDEPPLALQDPAWLRKTEALGPLHPYDPERFPRAEQFIESFFRYFLVGQAEHWGNYGFLDHGSGPHSFDVGSHDYREHPYPLLKRTFQFDYKFRSTPWRMTIVLLLV